MPRTIPGRDSTSDSAPGLIIESNPTRGGEDPQHRIDAEKILGPELAAINGGPVTRAADGTITIGNWMRNFYIPMHGANWRDAA